MMEDKEVVLARQREERKCLREIQKTRGITSKDDRKSVNENNCHNKALEREIKAEQQNEANFINPTEDTSCALTNLSLSSDSKNCENIGQVASHKMSRAAKRREKKATVQRAQENALLKAKAEESTTPRSIELKKLEHQLLARRLRLFTIPSNGDCLYSSIIHQLKLKGYQSSPDLIESTVHVRSNSPLNLSALPTTELVKIFRQLTANHVRANMDNFMPYMTSAETGEPLTLSEFEHYCDAIANTSTWGGEIELKALSNILEHPIEVLQAESVPLIIGEEFKQHIPITIVYHLHAFALGEHYNSCVPIDEASNTDE